MRRAGKGGADDGALDAEAAPVNEPDFAKAFRGGRLDVVRHDGRRLVGPERVEVERVLHRNRDGRALGARVIEAGHPLWSLGRLESGTGNGQEVMMKGIRPVALALAAALLAVAGPAAAQAKPRVAVIEFKNKVSGWSWGWYQAGTNAQDMFVTELVKQEKYRVIEREQLKAIMQEKGLALSGDLDPKTAMKVGKLLGVEYIITGALTELGAQKTNVSTPGFGWVPSTHVGVSKMECAIDARAFSVTTGEIVWADSAREETSSTSVYVAGAGGGVDDQRKLDKLVRPVVNKLADSLSKKSLSSSGMGGASDASGLAGKVARVDGGTLYLNVGSEAGVKEGDEFNVFRMGNPIKDPDTGEVLGQNETKVGRLRVEKVMGPRLATARAISGSGFKAGDAIKN